MLEIIVTAAQWSQDHQALIALRTQVFVKEQMVPLAEEFDGLDPECQHVKALKDDTIVGTARLLPNGYIGRMCVLNEYRKQHIGLKMLRYLVQQAVREGHTHAYLNSQTYAIPFYRKVGFVVDSEEFIEANIPHRRMKLNIVNNQ